MERKHLLVLGSYPPPYGGISSHLASLLPYLVKRGYSADVISPGDKPGEEAKGQFTVHRITKTYRDKLPELVTRAPALIGRALTSSRVDTEFFKAEVILGVAEKICRNKRVDLIAAYHLLPWGLVGAQLSLALKVPMVLTNFGEIYGEPELYERHRKDVQFTVEHAKRILASSAHCARSYEALQLKPEVEVIYYGVDLAHFSPSVVAEPFRNKIGFAPEHIVVSMIGRMIRDMGLHTFLDCILELLQTHANVRILIAGAKGELTEKAQEAAAKSDGKIQTIVDVPFKDLAAVYAASDIVVAPTKDNRACMGLSIKEAMATAKPVVAARVGGIPEAVIQGETGLLVAPEDPRALAQAIGTLCQDPARGRAMGAAGLARAQKLFDGNLTHQAYERVFRQAIESR